MEGGTPPGVDPHTPKKITDASQNNKKTTDASPETPNGRKAWAMYEDMRARFNELKKCCDDQMLAHEKSAADKDAIIMELKSRLEEPCVTKDDTAAPKVIKMNNSDVFVTKPRKGAKDAPSNECAISGCDNVNVDMIKCCMCGNLVCEDCSKVKVAKLRPLMNQCDTLFFTCQCCALSIRDDSDINPFDVLQGKVKTLTDELNTEEKKNNSLQRLLEERESALEETETKLVTLEQNAAVGEPAADTSIEEMISKRLDKIDQNIDALITKKLNGILPIPTSTSNGSENTPKLFSAVVGTSGSAENHIAATRNAEIVERQEQEKERTT